MSTFLWALTLAVLAIYVGFGIVLGYHWMRYSIRLPMMLISFAFYLIGGGFLLLLIIGATATLAT